MAYAAFLVKTDGKKHKGYFIGCKSHGAPALPCVLVSWGKLGCVQDTKTIFGPKNGREKFNSDKHAERYALKIVNTRIADGFSVLWSSFAIAAGYKWPDLQHGYEFEMKHYTKQYKGETPLWWFDVLDILTRERVSKAVAVSDGRLKVNVKGLGLKPESARLASLLRAARDDDDDDDPIATKLERRIAKLEEPKEKVYENKRQPRFQYVPRKKLK